VKADATDTHTRRFVASPLAEGERNKVRGLRAEEYHFEMFKAACRNRTLTLPLFLMKGEATQARPAISCVSTPELVENITTAKLMLLLGSVQPCVRQR
jgi:hypothetical protein